MATATKSKTTGFADLRCVHCGEIDSLDVRVDDLTVVCRDCGEQVTKEEVDAVVAKWSRLFRWIDSAGE